MGKQEVKLKAIMNQGQLVTYLEELIANLKTGTIQVQKTDESVVLYPIDPIKVEVEAEGKKDKNKFTLELTWRQEIVTEEKPISSAIPDQTALSDSDEMKELETVPEEESIGSAIPDQTILSGDEAIEKKELA
ncbi:MAG: amphi-Trp domain-containing protein [Deltaproteobacteria bacterium]|nr:amphi-Trp domain-containing protein [Deltaproteobacteria bacterium]